MASDPPTRAFVRYVDGRLVLTWQTSDGAGGWKQGGTRRLTFGERVLWRLARRTPRGHPG